MVWETRTTWLADTIWNTRSSFAARLCQPRIFFALLSCCGIEGITKGDRSAWLSGCLPPCRKANNSSMTVFTLFARIAVYMLLRHLRHFCEKWVFPTQQFINSLNAHQS